MLYQSIINVPGYLPEDDQQYFHDSIKEAWERLADDRRRDCEDQETECTWGCARCATDNTEGSRCWDDLAKQDQLGAVYLPSPGYTGDHDLGVAYSVTEHECSFVRWPDHVTSCAVCGHADYPHMIDTLPGCPACDGE